MSCQASFQQLPSESLLDEYDILSLSQEDLPPTEAMRSPTHHSATFNPLDMLKNTFSRLSNFGLRKDKCPNNWTPYPGSGSHASEANYVFGRVYDEIQKRQQRLHPPVHNLELTGYKFTTNHTGTYKTYYFLRIRDGENVMLFAKVGLTSGYRAQLLSLSNKECAMDKE